MSQGGGFGKRVRVAGTWRGVMAAGVGVLAAVAVLAGAVTARSIRPTSAVTGPHRNPLFGLFRT